jgi:hypothetical protein
VQIDVLPFFLLALKVLSSEMDPAEKLVSFARPPGCESPLKLQRHLVRLLAIWKQGVNDARRSVSGF